MSIPANNDLNINSAHSFTEGAESGTMSTDTPRTDAEAFESDVHAYEVVTSDFARTLERELAAKDAEIARLDNLRVSAENYAADFRKERDQLRAEVERLGKITVGELDRVAARMVTEYRVAYVNENARAEKAEAELAKLSCTMGVGSGSGALYVHGDYDSIKAAQAVVFEHARLRAEVAQCKTLLQEAADILTAEADSEQVDLSFKISAFLNKPEK